MTIDAALKALDAPETEKLFARLYGTEEAVLAEQKKRYAGRIKRFRERFGEREVRVFSSPGRSEIGGNHTDHNHGKVLAAGIQFDSIAVVSPAESIRISDSSYDEDYELDISGDLPPKGEKDSRALLSGIVEGFRKEGLKTGGFAGCFSSDVIPASGVSSSASFEMLVCHILNRLYNGGSVPVERMARIGQFAENVYWGKASGLLDQMACGFGGLVAMDFENPETPAVEKIPFDFAAQGYRLILVNTGGNHAGLSGEYSAVPAEMKQAARFFKRDVLRGISAEDLAKNLPALRARCGDRALMRAFHFVEENLRVDREVAALKANDFPAFLRHVTDSGNSSWKWLQNVYVSSDCVKNQSVSLSLALTEIFIDRHGLRDKAACRVHGGGFAGVIQVFLPAGAVEEYRRWMLEALNPAANAVFVMSVRPYGVLEVLSE
jgi:galactokinase